jgi:hypothetical protein
MAGRNHHHSALAAPPREAQWVGIRGSGLAETGDPANELNLGGFRLKPEATCPCSIRRFQNKNLTCSWNILGGSIFASAGSAWVAVPALTSWPKAAFGVPVSP